jgi:UDP-glucose 4-epimerase
MRVVVTGGAGYIGGFAAERLVELGHEVIVFDNLWRGHSRSVPAGTTLVQVDITNRDQVISSVKDAAPEAIMHFAAATLVPESVAKPGLYFHINVTGSQNLIEGAVQSGCKKIVVSSTAAVYGVPEVIPVPEDLVKKPINPYGLSKLMVEQMLEWHASADGLNWTAFRYFNVAGATKTRGEDHEPETHVIPNMLAAVLGKRDKFTVFGTDYPTPDGTAIRDYVDVQDLADAHVLALEHLDKPLGAFNLGTKHGFSVKQLVDAVEGVTGKPLPVEYGPRRAGDPPILVADSTRIRTELGWNPTRSTVEHMIQGTWDWMTNNPNGYQ